MSTHAPARHVAPALAAALPFATAVLLAPPNAAAWEFRSRFVERVGAVDTPLTGNAIDASSTAPRRIRIQFGVFDDAAGAAPPGGVYGWNAGAVIVSGTPSNSDERRTPGRLAPFFTQGHGNGEPAADPFDSINLIEAVMQIQSRAWNCNPDGTTPPPPPARTWGLNTFDSVFEFTIDPSPGASSYTVTFLGSLVGVAEWRLSAEFPPDCRDPDNPNDDEPGLVSYTPFPTPPRTFTSVLHVEVPTPSTVAALLACLPLARRHRGTFTPAHPGAAAPPPGSPPPSR